MGNIQTILLKLVVQIRDQVGVFKGGYLGVTDTFNASVIMDKLKT